MRRVAPLAALFLRSRILGRAIPLIASVKLTYRCNLSCSACPFHRLAATPGTHMDWATATGSLDTLSEMGCPIVVFEGGEPLLWSDGEHTFTDLARYARERFVCTAATTNGTLPLDVPTDVLWVSLDGTRETHNLLRSGSYDDVMASIRSSRHRRLYVHTTLNRMNFQELPEMVRMVSGMPTVSGITVQLFYPYNRGEENLALSVQQRREALAGVLRLKRQGFPVLNSSWGIHAMMDNTWTCRQDLLVNVNPDGSVSQGCYVKDRSDVVCSQCGFTPVAEASGAFSLRPGAIVAGLRIFL
ncbi:MAG TPA: radical SAM protein [Deltaproteobacteria bacterium]|nr:radical SAM protein [Deltaproteobacteria bacterium]